MAGRQLTSHTVSSVVAQPKILNTALSIAWFNMSELVIGRTLSAYNNTGRQIVFRKDTQTSSELAFLALQNIPIRLKQW